MNVRGNDFRKEELSFHGTSIVSGIARGKVRLLKNVDLQKIINDKHTVNLISSEWARIDFSVKRSRDQLLRFINSRRHSINDKSYLIFKAELRFMNDLGIITDVKKTIERTSLPVESVLARKILKIQDTALLCTNELKEKNLITMQDLYYRLLYNMQFSNEDRITAIMNIPEGSVLVADRLTPVEVAVIPVEKVVGILIEESSRSSHASIMAQTIGIPVIIDFPSIGSLVNESSDVLIDAYNGTVFLNPTDATVKKCRKREIRYTAAKQRTGSPGDASTVHSIDGLAVHLSCNASNLADIVHARSRGIREIGLFRSEIRYFAGTVLPSAEQERAYYTGIFGVEGIGCMNIRLLDMGGDKLPVYMQMEKETDPQLGCRGVRFLLSHPDIMKSQVRSILTARGTFCIQLILPFITTTDDLAMARVIINEVIAEEHMTAQIPPIGIMVEVPSVALSIERFLPKVDFVCLGTNDLVQYIFSVNREQFDVQKYNRFSHPVFIKLLKEVVDSCKKHGTHLTVCGEMASDSAGCCLLAAIGATCLSIQPNAATMVHDAIKKLDAAALRNILPELYELETADEVEQKIKACRSG